MSTSHDTASSNGFDRSHSGFNVHSRPDYLHDILSKERVGKSNTLPSSYAYDVATIDDVPIEQTKYFELIQEISKSNKAIADELCTEHEKVRGAARRLLDVRKREEEELKKRNAIATEHNKNLDVKVEARKKSHMAEIAMVQTTLQNHERELPKAHRQAGHLAAVLGYVYNPEFPDPQCVLSHQPEALESVAASLKLPWTPDDDKIRLSKMFAHILTIGTGVGIGISLGFLCRFYDPDTIMRRFPLAFLFALIGIVITYAAGEAVKLFFKSVSERYWLGYPAKNWLPLLTAALVFAGVIVVTDSKVQQHGILTLVNAENAMLALSTNAVQTSHDGGLFFLVGMIFSLPYVAMNAWHGYLLGRHKVCLNQMIAERDRRFAITDKEVRNKVEVQQALSAISRVLDIIRQKAALEQRLKDAQDAFETQLAALEETRLDDKAGLDETAKQRIQDAYRNLQGAQHEFDEKLARAIKMWNIPEPKSSVLN